jgi:putative transposase
VAGRHTPEQVISNFCEAERVADEDATTAGADKQFEVSEQTPHRWRAECGGLQAEGATRLKGLETEILQLKGIVADQALDVDVMREVARKNC